MPIASIMRAGTKPYRHANIAVVKQAALYVMRDCALQDQYY